MSATRKEILTSEEIGRALMRMAHEILEKNRGWRNLALIGVQTRGVFLAQRLAERIAEIEKVEVPVGVLDITLYRDDVASGQVRHEIKKTDIAFPIDLKKIVLVDDVLYTGRSIRAAIDGIIDLGRPSKIQLAVLIDRGRRELPIQPDYVGKSLSLAKNSRVKVMLTEEDGEDRVIIDKEE